MNEELCDEIFFFLLTWGSCARAARCISLWGKLAGLDLDWIIFILIMSRGGKLPGCRRVLKSSTARLQLPLDQVHVPLLAKICSVLSSSRGQRRPSLVGIMSRAEPERETSLRSPHIKPSDCHYRPFSPCTSPTSTPTPPSLSSSSCAWVKTPFLELHDKWKRWRDA